MRCYSETGADVILVSMATSRSKDAIDLSSPAAAARPHQRRQPYHTLTPFPRAKVVVMPACQGIARFGILLQVTLMINGIPEIHHAVFVCCLRNRLFTSVYLKCAYLLILREYLENW